MTWKSNPDYKPSPAFLGMLVRTLAEYLFQASGWLVWHHLQCLGLYSHPWQRQNTNPHVLRRKINNKRKRYKSNWWKVFTCSLSSSLPYPEKLPLEKKSKAIFNETQPGTTCLSSFVSLIWDLGSQADLSRQHRHHGPLYLGPLSALGMPISWPSHPY